MLNKSETSEIEIDAAKDIADSAKRCTGKLARTFHYAGEQFNNRACDSSGALDYGTCHVRQGFNNRAGAFDC